MSAVGLLQVVALVTIIFSFITGIDIPHRNVDLFSQFRLQYFVVSVLLVFLFAALRNPIFAGALLVTAIFNASFVIPWYFHDAPIGTGTPLKLLQTNVLSSNTDYHRLIDLVREVNPDMIFLQEVTQEWVHGTKSLLQDYPYAYSEPRSGNFGIAMFSKTALESLTHIDSPPLGHPTIVATALLNGETLTLISTHPTIPIGRSLYESRNEHLRSVAELVAKTSGNVVLLGDLNASIWDRQYRKLVAATGLSNARKGAGILPTWPTYLPFAMIPIDHVMVSEGLGVVDARVGKRIGSDHLPLIVTVSTRAAER